MQSVLFIGGGDSYSDRADFLNALQTRELRNPTGEESKRWSQTFREDLGDAFLLVKPNMPNVENANYDEWKIWFERHLAIVSEPLVLVGWSLGGMFILKYLSEHEISIPIRSLIIMGAPAGYYEDDTGNDCGSFKFEPESLRAVADQVSDIYILHSTDDFVVPYEHALQLKKALPEANLVTFKDKNHFLIEQFPELIDLIKKSVI